MMYRIEIRRNRWNSRQHPKAYKTYLVPMLWSVWENIRHKRGILNIPRW